MGNDKRLAGLLVLCPTRDGLEFQTEVSIDQLEDAGARKVRSSGNSDVAMHRCQAAGAAEAQLKADSTLNTIMWLDGDMVAPVEVVHSMMQLVHHLARQRPHPEGDAVDPIELEVWREKNAPALSGAYVKRNHPEFFALAKANPPIPPLTIGVIGRNGKPAGKVSLPAIVSGMGCLFQTAQAFLEHCQEAPRITSYDGESTFPAITASGPGKNVNDEVTWGSEDWTYTSWEWQAGRGVYLSQENRFGHICKSVQWPTDATKFPG